MIASSARTGLASAVGARDARRQIATLVVLAVLGAALLLTVPALRPVLREIEGMSGGWVLVAAGLELASCASFVVLFCLIFDRVGARDAHALAWTSLGAGALLPAGGVGGLAIGAWAISLSGAPTPWIVRRSTALFLLTSAVSVLTVIPAGLVLCLAASGREDFFLAAFIPVVVAAVLLMLTIGVARAAPPSREDRPALLCDVIAGVREAWQLLLRPSWRLAGAVGYLWFDIAVLWATFTATGRTPPPAALVLGYLIGYLANALPVPGGIAILDAGLASALVLYGADATSAAAAVLVYHAIANWIPGLGGLLAFAGVRRRLGTRAVSPRASSA